MKDSLFQGNHGAQGSANGGGGGLAIGSFSSSIIIRSTFVENEATG